VGKALTSKLFVTANAGFCLGSSQGAFSAQNLGASLEYRFRRSPRRGWPPSRFRPAWSAE
jgi:hypothetical protein